MPDFRDFYRIPLLSAKNLGKNTLRSVINAVYPETQTKEGGGTKDVLVIELEDGEVRIALNKGNAVQLAEKFGRDYTEWVGKKIVVAIKKTTFMGKPCDGLNVQPVK